MPYTPDPERGGPARAALWISALVMLVVVIACIASAVRSEVIHNDRGGSISERITQIEALQAAGETVEITGLCLSSCTMMLAVGCAHPDAVLGFHGPRGMRGSR